MNDTKPTTLFEQLSLLMRDKSKWKIKYESSSDEKESTHMTTATCGPFEIKKGHEFSYGCGVGCDRFQCCVNGKIHLMTQEQQQHLSALFEFIINKTPNLNMPAIELNQEPKP